MTSIQPGAIAALRKRVADNNERRVAASTRLAANKEEEARLLSQAHEQYGLDTLADLAAHADAEDAAIAVDAAALTVALDAAQAAAAAVPS